LLIFSVHEKKKGDIKSKEIPQDDGVFNQASKASNNSHLKREN